MNGLPSPLGGEGLPRGVIKNTPQGKGEGGLGIPPTLILPHQRLCRNEGNAMLVILNEVKNLIESIS